MKIKMLAALGLGLILSVTTAFAGKVGGQPGGGKRKENRAGFEKKHPRRTQVLKRGDRQTNQVNKAAAGGKLNHRQAQQDRVAEAKIHSQEERDAAKNGGHITKGEQAHLNREETHEENHIKAQEAHDAARKNGGAPAATAPAPAAAPGQ